MGEVTLGRSRERGRKRVPLLGPPTSITALVVGVPPLLPRMGTWREAMVVGCCSGCTWALIGYALLEARTLRMTGLTSMSSSYPRCSLTRPSVYSRNATCLILFGPASCTFRAVASVKHCPGLDPASAAVSAVDLSTSASRQETCSPSSAASSSELHLLRYASRGLLQPVRSVGSAWDMRAAYDGQRASRGSFRGCCKGGRIICKCCSRAEWR